jgi:hypothetical protein
MRGLEPLSPAIFEAWNGLLEGALAVHDRFLVLEHFAKRLNRAGIPANRSL